MRIIYMYIQSFGFIKQKGFLFDSHYSVTITKKGNELYLLINKSDNSIDNILYGNVSITAIVGENGVGKSTCLDALQSWLIDCNSNPGVIIWEQDNVIYYQTIMEAIVNAECALPVVRYSNKNESILPLNAVYFSDVFEYINNNSDTNEENKSDKNHVQSYENISTSGILRKYINDRTHRVNPFRALYTKDSLLKIQLADRFNQNIHNYPWKVIHGKKLLTFELKSIKFIDNYKRKRGEPRCNDENYRKISKNIVFIKSSCRRNGNWKLYNQTILLEGLFTDYIQKIMYAFNDRVLQYDTPIDDALGLIFQKQLEDSTGASFLHLAFDMYDQQLYDDSVKELLKGLPADIHFPSFEHYVLLYKKLHNKEWIMNGIEFTTDRQVRTNYESSIEIPNQETIQDLYSTYLDVHTYRDIIRFEWSMSSGESSISLLFARLYNAVQRSQVKNDDDVSYLILIDEIDSLYHPRWQQQIVYWITMFINYVFPWYDFQILITTHSPVLLSDIPERNVIFLPNENMYEDTEILKHNETFAANISTLYYDAFFMHEGSIGEIAKQTVDMLYDILNKDYGNSSYKLAESEKDIMHNKEELAKRISSMLLRRYDRTLEIDTNDAEILLSKLIDIVGEEIWREQLRAKYDKYFKLSSANASLVDRIKEILNSLPPKERENALKEIMEDGPYK